MVSLRPARGLLTAALLALLTTWASAARADEHTLVIAHTNDVHGQVHPVPARWIDRENPPMVGGFEALAATVERVRTDATLAGEGFLLLDAGDLYQGTPEGNLTKGRITVDLFNRLRYDAVVMGNHELDYGQQVVADMSRRAHFPMLAANVFDERIGKRPTWLKDFVVRHTGGLDVGIVGLTTSQMKILVTPEPLRGLRFDLEEEAAVPAIAAARRAGAQCIVLVTHSGVGTDRRLAARFAGTDVVAIVGGHSHTKLNGLSLDGLPIVQAGSRGLAVGRLRLVIDPDREVPLVSAKSELIDVMKGEDEQARRIVNRYAPEIDAVMNEQVGVLQTDLGKRRGFESSPLGDFLADIMREKTGADVAFHNKGGIRATLAEGPIKLRDLYQVSPFDNTIFTLTITGAELRQVLEQSAKSGAGALEVSGLTARFDPKREVGQRVVEALVGGKPIDPARRYKVATNNFVAGGGDGHATLAGGEDRKDTGILLRTATVEYFREHSPVRYEFEPRVRVVREPGSSGE